MFELTFDPPGTRPRLATVTLLRSGATANRLRPEDLERAEAVLDALEGEHDVQAWILRSAQPGSFLEGLETATFAALRDRRSLQELSLRANALLRRIERSPRPVIAAIHGACLGAGFELALACAFRLCTDAGPTVLGLPQVDLGLIPGAGGTHRLPRLVGVATAARLVVTGRKLAAREAHELGLVDLVVGVEALELAARDAAIRLASGRVRLRDATRRGWGRLAGAGNPIARRRLFKRMREEVRERTQGLHPAPLCALDVMERSLGRSPEDAARLEASAVAELAMGEPSRARVAIRLRAEALACGEDGDDANARPGRLQRLGLCGAGTMGADIAVAAAEAGLAVRIREADAVSLGTALERVRSQWDRRARAAGESVVFRARTRLSGALDLAGFETMDFVLEAVPEDLELKRRVFEQLHARVSPDAILASHTRALPIGAIAAGLPGRERVVGLRFFKPLRRMPLCEIVRTDETSGRALATSLALARRIGKTPIIVRDTPGFYTTRVLGLYLLAAIEMLEEGHEIGTIDAGARRAGWPIGPLRLLDEVGLDVGARVARILTDAFPDRLRIPDVLLGLVRRGGLGRRAGRGFYLYESEGARRPDPAVRQLLPSAVPKPASVDELGDRLTLVAALEAVRCLHEDVIASASDGDVGAVLGIGYPVHRGGPFRHLRQQNLSALRGRLASLADRFGARYAAPDELAILEQLHAEPPRAVAR